MDMKTIILILATIFLISCEKPPIEKIYDSEDTVKTTQQEIYEPYVPNDTTYIDGFQYTANVCGNIGIYRPSDPGNTYFMYQGTKNIDCYHLQGLVYKDSPINSILDCKIYYMSLYYQSGGYKRIYEVKDVKLYELESTGKIYYKDTNKEI